MKTFVVLLSDKQRELMNESLIKAHVSYLDSIWKKGSLIFCGPCADQTALMILKAESLDQTKKLVEDDPFSEVSYYQTVEFKEIQEANPKNNFHLDEVLGDLRNTYVSN